MIARSSLALGAVLLASPAFAGGFTPTVAAPAPAAPVVVAPAPVAPVAASDWTGFYVGGQLGYGNATVDGLDPALEDEYDGAIYGLHAGYQYDFGRFVLGGELDWDATDMSIDPFENATAVDVDSIARAKLRAGYDAGRFMPYATVGYAAAFVSSEDDATDAALDDRYDGYFFGAGVDYAVRDNITVGAEVLRHNFDDAPFDNIDMDVTTATLRASFRF